MSPLLSLAKTRVGGYLYTTMAVPYTLREMMLRSFRDFDESLAYAVTDGSRYRYRDIAYAVAGFHRLFSRYGIQKGDRIALIGESHPSWPAAYLAVVSSPAVVVPILQEFPVADVVSVLEHSGARLILASQKQNARIGDSVEATSLDVKLIELESNFAAYIDAADSSEPDDEPVGLDGPHPDDTAAIIYTSGTTGHSKGVVLTHGNITSNIDASDTCAYFKHGEKMLSILPLAHTYECTLGMLLPFSRGATVHYLDRPAAPTVLMAAMQSVQPDLMLAVPLLIEKIVRSRVVPALSKGAVGVLRRIPILSRLIYRAAGRKLKAAFGGKIRFFGIGGAPLAADVEDILYRIGFPYALGYGLTETAPLLAGSSPGDNRRRTIGPVIPDVEIRIEDGEILARGPNVMKGYYKNPEMTAEVLDEDGWFSTGDLGSFDATGRLRIDGRKKSVIIGANGENIYPEAIESVLTQDPTVEEALVIKRGTQLIAMVRFNYELLSSATGTAAETVADFAKDAGAAIGDAGEVVQRYLEQLRRKANERLSAFARISEVIEQIDPFEKTPTLKIKRYLYH